METHSNSPASADEAFRMIDVGAKAVTARRALAEGWIELSPQVLERVKKRTLPKGDALVLAEVAGIMAAKNTSLLIPLCHPLPLDAVLVRCEVQEHGVRVEAEARANAKTGVEMEALVAVQAALLTIYDLCKGLDPALTIGQIKLVRKEGGKSGLWIHPERVEQGINPSTQAALSPKLEGVRAAVVTISDRCYEGVAEDRSGDWLADFLEAQGALLGKRFLVPDDIDSIRQVVSEAADRISADLIVCTGGTGLAPRDRTPEALLAIFDRQIPGFGELLRSSGAQHTQMAYLSRSGAGILGHSLVIYLPGSTKAVQEGMASMLPLLPHAFHILKGGQHQKPIEDAGEA